MVQNLSLKEFIKNHTLKESKGKEGEEYLNIPFIKKDMIELREYQKSILENINNKNTLVVLPTGLGKTIIAIVLSAIRLNMYSSKSILILAPTKPLIQQHAKSFKSIMDFPSEKFFVISGGISKDKRKELWKKQGIFFATPQTVKNDIEEGILSLKDFSLVVFDEAHRSVGDYAYTFISKRYMEECKEPLILGLTASPGGEVEKIGSVIGNLYIENVEIRSYNDPDVKPYIKDIEIEWVHVELPPPIKHISALLKACANKRAEILVSKGIIHSKNISKKDLLETQKRIAIKIKESKSDFLFYIQGILGQLIKINYSLELVETQGLKQFIEYYEKLKKEEKKTRPLKELLEDEDFTTAYLMAKKQVEKQVIHPKIEKMEEIIKKINDKNHKIIIFTQYVETAKIITERIKDYGAVLFIGQRKGYTQKKQIDIIEKFKKGEYSILVATSVAEEGLDIPAVDYVIFYEPIPSEIRTIQRRGRTGRFNKGKVIILMTSKSLDEAYYWSSIAKERKMRRTLHILKRMFSQSVKKVTQKEKVSKTESINNYAKEKKVSVVFDHREDKLYTLFNQIYGNDNSFLIKKDTLSIGDIIINNQIIIERKTSDDFISSIIDGRLFSQLDKLIYHYDLPILLIEGNIYDSLMHRNIHENVIRGVLSKIAIEYHIPVIWTRDLKDSAAYINLMSKRLLEEKDAKRSVKIIKKSTKIEDQIQTVVGSLPSINTTLGERLLKKFKSIKNIANATIEQLKTVEGIGEKKAKKIYEVFNTEYKSD